MKITFLKDEYDITLREEQYANGKRLAIQAYCKVLLDELDPQSLFDEPFGMVTTNLHNEALADGEFFVKIYSEGEWIKQLLAAGWFIDTGRRVASGHVMIPVWKKGPNYVCS